MRSTISLVTILIFLIMGSAGAWVNADSVLYVVKTSTVPVIDGQMDDIWKMVGKERLTRFDLGAATAADNWFDLFATMRTMWDDENLYLFIEIYDDQLATTAQSSSDYNFDSVELYFDADNSKRAGAFDGTNDIQIRYNLDQTAIADIDLGYGNGGTDWGFSKDASSYAALATTMGWNLEVQIPLDDLKIPTGEDANGHEFGFDVQVNDRDGTQRDHLLRWWAQSDLEWSDASLFGNARLVNEYVVSDYALPVVRGAFTPTIDGILDDGWHYVPELSENAYSANNALNKSDWKDGTFNFRIMWDDEKLYMFTKAWDDLIQTIGDYQADGFEYYFDGDNSKMTGNYDGTDDVQLRVKYGIASTDEINAGGVIAPAGFAKETIEFATLETDDGWNIEWSVPLATLNIYQEAETEFGFDIQLNESDQENVRETASKWWSASDDSWKNASLFGTAVLKSYTFTASVDAKGQIKSSPDHFTLSQNYPNPFNPTTRINYSISAPGLAKLVVFDLLGKQVSTLVNEVKPAGSYEIEFNGFDLASGIYFYKLESATESIMKKMTLLR